MPVEDPAAARQALVPAFRNGSVRVETIVRRAAAALYASWPETDTALAADDLLGELLVSAPAYPIWLEGKLTELRRRFLLQGGGDELAPLLSRLAIQCHLNEYAWAADPEERGAVEALTARIGSLTPAEIMTLACYVSLANVAGAEGLMQQGWSGPVEDVLREQIGAALQEQALDTRIPTLTPIRHGVSEGVRAQYEANPYPRWRRVAPMPTLAVIFGWKVPPAPNVLFAGCGTGYHAIHAGQRYAGARVLGVDLSRASLRYALRKTREAGIRNMGFAQADLLELGSIGWSFDVIECSGVLHHMSDPFEGARALCGVLKPGGLMKIGLYSATARADLKPAKALAKIYTPETIPELRRAISDAPVGDPVKAPMRFTDFYATSPCRDLLMHVQEHEMDMADLRRMLAENGLRFLGFALGDEVRAAYREMFPEDRPARDLHRWEAFEQQNPATFGAMYQFWAVKAG